MEKIKKEKLIIKILMIAVLVIYIVFYIGLAINSKNKISEIENRTLATVPEISIESISDSKFQTGLESSMADHFAFRSAFRDIKTFTLSITGRTYIEGVYKSDDGYLIQGFTGGNKELMEKQTKAINEFTSKYSDKNHYLLISPTASDIYGSKLPTNAPVKSEEEYINDFSSKLNESIKMININKNLASHSNEAIYYKTDHHWTSLGAYYAYKQTASVMNLNTASDKYEALPVTDDFTGSLVKMSGFNSGECDTINVYLNELTEIRTSVYYTNEQKKTPSLYNSEALKGSDKYQVFMGENAGEVIINSTSSVNSNLLIIKDSYANCFIPFLTPHFQKIVVIDPRYYYDDIDELMNVEKITDVMYLYNAKTLSEDTSLVNALNGN